jgi:hypothetical protein
VGWGRVRDANNGVPVGDPCGRADSALGCVQSENSDSLCGFRGGKVEGYEWGRAAHANVGRRRR